MKRTDEMKLGDELRGFCDCNQGRLCCTCRQFAEKVFDRAAKVLNEGVNLDEAFVDLVQPRRKADARPERLLANTEELVARINDAPEPFDRGEYWCEVAMKRGKQLNEQWLEIRSLGTRVQIRTALAILGWAAFFLELLRV